MNQPTKPKMAVSRTKHSQCFVDTNRKVHVRIIGDISSIDYKQITNEISSLEKVSNLSNVVPYRTVPKKTEEKTMVIHRDYIDKVTNLHGLSILSQEDQIQIIIQITEIVYYFHENDLILKNISLENILVDTNDKTVYITDYGITQFVLNKRGFSAPEILENGLFETSKEIDIWYLGNIIYYILVGSLPYDQKNLMKKYQEIVRNEIKFPRNINKKTKIILKNMLNSDPNQRPVIKEVYEYFRNEKTHFSSLPILPCCQKSEKLSSSSRVLITGRRRGIVRTMKPENRRKSFLY